MRRNMKVFSFCPGWGGRRTENKQGTCLDCGFLKFFFVVIFFFSSVLLPLSNCPSRSHAPLMPRGSRVGLVDAVVASAF